MGGGGWGGGEGVGGGGQNMEFSRVLKKEHVEIPAVN